MLAKSIVSGMCILNGKTNPSVKDIIQASNLWTNQSKHYFIL